MMSADAERSGKSATLLVRNSVVACSDFFCLFLRQLGRRTFGAAFNLRKLEATSLNSVLHVGFLCACIQMIRVAATWVITRVANVNALLNWTVGQFKSHRVRGSGFSIKAEQRVVGFMRAHPSPAFIWLASFNLRPKALFNWHCFAFFGPRIQSFLSLFTSLFRCELSMPFKHAIALSLSFFICHWDGSVNALHQFYKQ